MMGATAAAAAAPIMDRSDPTTKSSEAEGAAYWRANLRILAVLLTIWFSVSYGAGILFAEALNRWTLPGTGFPLGFWFAQQGAIYTFVVLIFVYVWLMNRLDRRFGYQEV